MTSNELLDVLYECLLSTGPVFEKDIFLTMVSREWPKQTANTFIMFGKFRDPGESDMYMLHATLCIQMDSYFWCYTINLG